MVKQFIDLGIKQIDFIFHLADIHIRNVKRHEEYRSVFKKTYSYIKKNCTKNSVIYLAGDIAHAKTDMSPELVDMIGEFLRSCADICPTILIAGNHDCNLNNSHRLDALTPIVKSLKHPRLFYLRDTGLYEGGGVVWNVMSVFDKPADFIHATSFDAEYKVALHHGAVNNAQTELGFELSNMLVNDDLFAGHDLVLLGDIHKRQYLNKEQTIAYPGSLIQQNHAEELIHGLMVWDIATKSSEFVPIENDYGYYTLLVQDGVLTNWIDEIPKRPRLRIKSANTDSARLKEIIAEVRRKRKVEEISIQKVNGGSVTRVNRISVGNVRDIEYQNELITEYLNQDPSVTDEVIDAIRHINRNTNSKLNSVSVTRNVTWIPKRFEFDNMFSYGPGNVVDFENMAGTYGLFAPNASGKSTLLDALSFCCFDRCSRTNKAIHVLNNKKSSFASKFVFELDGIQYTIKRSGTKNKNGHVKVDVEFYCIDHDGNETSLNGDQRDSTNKNIRSYLGEYEDFLLTALSMQTNNTGFIDLSQRERKDLLASFLDINVFEQLYLIANDDVKETAALLKEHRRSDYGSQIATAKTDIEQYTRYLKVLENEQCDADELRKGLNNLITQTTALIQSIGDIESEPEIREKIGYYEVEIDALNRSIDTFTNDLSDIQNQIDSYESKLSSIDIDDLKQRLTTYHDIQRELSTLENDIRLVEQELKHCNSVIHQLDTHEYDPNCQYCVQNTFVQSAMQAKDKLPEIENKLLGLRKEHDNLKMSSDSMSKVIAQNEFVTKMQQELTNLHKTYNNMNSKLQMVSDNKRNDESKLQLLNERLEKSIEYKDILKANNEYQSQIEQYQSELQETEDDIKAVQQRIIKISGQLEVAKRVQREAEAGISTLSELESQYIAYEQYLNAIKRDGVPYMLIEKALPQIEAEINNILSQIVEFNVNLSTDGKNINAHIVYDEDNFWPIELVSGMERFISSLAIRTSLINVSSLPRPNFLAIDEGFGVLDSENMNSMYMLFDYLKSQFGFLLCISHIDTMRDVVDKLIEIKKVGGYSKVEYE
jgi:DNA repair exonuclease SbcCD ATPase subunit/DNA repair exonuclease SbcCD nuclease subunit